MAEHCEMCKPRYFYPRPPRGGRPARKIAAVNAYHISIHALREEGDQKSLQARL